MIPYIIQHNLHVEYFVWTYLRNFNDSGFYHFRYIDPKFFCIASIKQKLYKKLGYECLVIWEHEMEDINKVKNKLIKSWQKTKDR